MRGCNPVMVLVLMSVLLAASGCNETPAPTWTPEKRLTVAKQAGEGAGLLYLALDKPEKEKAAAIKVVVDKIRANLGGYREGGFIGAQPGIAEAVNQLFPKPEDEIRRLAALKLSRVLLEELDQLFTKHSDWKTLGNESAQIVGAFLDGASSSFAVYASRELKP